MTKDDLEKILRSHRDFAGYLRIEELAQCLEYGYHVLSARWDDGRMAYEVVLTAP